MKKKSDKMFKVTNRGNGTGEILFYADVGYWGITALEFQQQIRELGNVSKVDLRVISEGGSVIDGIGIYNAIRAHKAAWTVYIDGLAASSASWMILAAEKIIMAENAQYMVHRAQGMVAGTAEEMIKTANLIKDIEQTAMVNAYKSKTGKTDAEIMALLDAETWMNATQALTHGFVDEVSATLEMAASVKLSGRYDYTNAPASLLQNASDDSADNKSGEVVEMPRLQAAKLAQAKLKY